MNDVIVTKRRRSWEWRVQDQNGRVIMSGRERTRPAARYQGYRNLFMLLSVGQRPGDPQALCSGRNREPAIARVRSDRNVQAAPSAPTGRPSDGFNPD
ncbi:hypothetical protein [Bradyrhizobium icense]|uniref:hypothetical protein n=1 Tax=Bradyrhizobium icense TaxID=1274631 RepID=UPI0009F2C121|nr:hypothetical protein [Bradyrhizobium icense]